MTERTEGFDLTSTYVELADGGAGATIAVTEDFWPSLIAGERQIAERLVIASDVTEDMGHWEMHPAGEELLILMSGAVEIVLEVPEGERRVALAAGRACLVPRGTWHRFEVREPGRLVFVTYGEGTQHKPL